jgi:inositol 3-alpha-galactosyltransferase
VWWGWPNKGLGKAGSAHPLVVAVLPDVPVEHRSTLVSQGCTVEPVYPPPLENPNPSAVAFDGVTNYSKLRIWGVLYLIIKETVRSVHCNSS